MINESVFSNDWKKSNAVPIHKKESKKLIKNYRPISLLPIFSKIYQPLQFNSADVQIADSQKHLGLMLGSKLNFNEHIENKITKCNKIIGLMERLSLILSRKSLLTIYKSFVRPNLNYADMIYDKTFNESLKRKIEMVQYNAALIITGAFKGTSRDKIYQELGLESLADRRWTRKLFFFTK